MTNLDHVIKLLQTAGKVLNFTIELRGKEEQEEISVLVDGIEFSIFREVKTETTTFGTFDVPYFQVCGWTYVPQTYWEPEDCYDYELGPPTKNMREAINLILHDIVKRKVDNALECEYWNEYAKEERELEEKANAYFKKDVDKLA